MTTIELLEGVPRRFPRDGFAESIADELYQVHRARIGVEYPQKPNDYHYVLQSKGYVGQIPLGRDTCLTIKPKVPIVNIFRMLEYAYNLRSFKIFDDDIISSESIPEIFERLAGILADQVLTRARKGLYKGYVEHCENSAYVRGRLHATESQRGLMKGRVNLECQYEENTIDLAENQILAWTLHSLPRFQLQNDSIKRKVRLAYLALAGSVEVKPFEARECIKRNYNRLNDDYQIMHGLCRFFLEHSGPGLGLGEHEFIPFLVNMPQLFESFVAKWLKEHSPEGVTFSPQYSVDIDANAPVRFRIDILVKDRYGHNLAVMDTKYKILEPHDKAPDEPDLQQIVSYATVMNTHQAILVYPLAIASSFVGHFAHITVRSVGFDLGKDLKNAGTDFLKDIVRVLPAK